MARNVTIRPERPFERSATNYVIEVDEKSYVTANAGIFTTVLVEARIYHSDYAARCGLAQHRPWLEGKEVEIKPLLMSTEPQQKGKKNG
jgi:hypothetical protein